jgi:hypothetical protein
MNTFNRLSDRDRVRDKALCGTVRPGFWIFSPCSAKRLRADPVALSRRVSRRNGFF